MKTGKANEIYNRAKRNGLTLEYTCVDISQWKWEELMKGATKANKAIVDQLVTENTNGEFLDFIKFYNPYNHYKTESHIIFVHSGIEHFFRIND